MGYKRHSSTLQTIPHHHMRSTPRRHVRAKVMEGVIAGGREKTRRIAVSMMAQCVLQIVVTMMRMINTACPLAVGYVVTKSGSPLISATKNNAKAAQVRRIAAHCRKHVRIVGRLTATPRV